MVSGKLAGDDLLRQRDQLVERARKDFGLQRQLARPKVLVVDDEPHILRLLNLTLRKHFEVIEATSANEAIYKARTELPNLILSDLLMPTMNGEELCAELRRHKETKYIPFLFLSAMADQRWKLSTLKTDAADYLTKPFEAKSLVNSIKSNLLL